MIGIVCGGGDYPRLVAKACIEKRFHFCLIFLNDFCDIRGWPDAPSTSINLGEIEKGLAFLRQNEAKKIIFAGHIKRPNIRQLCLDNKGKAWLLKLGKRIFAGDDTFLRAIAELVQSEGLEIIAGTNLLKGVFLPEGTHSKRKPSRTDMNSITTGLRAARRCGVSDQGQSVIISMDGHVLGCEDSSGTDALIEKCGKRSLGNGILVKISKPQQDYRFDLPTIGVKTVEILHKNGFAGVAVEADKCIILNKEALIKRANDLGLFIVAVNVSAMKIFMIAGEASGDYLGGKLMDDISELTNRKVEFSGIGGECMEKAGLKKIFSISELSLIGIWEVIDKIFRIKKLINRTVNTIGEYRPSAIVTIDSPSFTHHIAKKIKKMGWKIPIIHYVAPTVWAWRQWRAKSLCKFLDKLLVLLPFESAYFPNIKTIFVGHPIVTDPDFAKPDGGNLHEILRHRSPTPLLVITLLPGSRMSEILSHMPILEEFADMMVKKYGSVQFIIPTMENLKQHIDAMIDSWPQKPIVVSQKSEKISAYYLSNAAVAASGTVTLELARVGLPFVAIYKTSMFTYWIIKCLIQVKNVCLVNLLARNSQNAVPELLQKDCNAENIFRHVEKILSISVSAKQKQTFKKVMKLLKRPPGLAAKEIISASNRTCKSYR
ncbi:MAG: lipid-A-disaccharide synthase [Holosporaceae bacterium]|jgi:lipid-A-disaccharide synthase|nr:lipid-A-disaccharide synthase [Holosporaceae bacterium]